MEPPRFCYGIVGHNHDFAISSHILDGAWTMKNPRWSQTLGELAEKLEKHHALFCKCGFDLSLVDNIWRADLTWELQEDVALEAYRPQATQRMTRDTRLADLVLPTPEQLAKTIPIMFGRDYGDDIRRKLFRSILRLRGDVCRVSYKPTCALLEADAVGMPYKPGTVYVDRCDLFVPWFRRRGSMKRIPIIRRPPRFGKSTFLSICAATYGDRHGDFLLPFPRDPWETMPVWSLVLVLDFAKLDFCAGMEYGECPTDADMIRRCNDFMKDAAEAFLRRYAPNEAYPPAAPAGTDWECHYYPHHVTIQEFARDCGRELFLGIDNYTQPFLRRDMTTFASVEFALWRAVLAPFLDSGLVSRGFVTGAEMPGGLHPFEGYPAFAAATEDLTYDRAFAHAIGLSAADVRDLAHVLLGAEFDVASAVRLPDAPDAVLCTGDVLDALRDVHAQNFPDAPGGIRWMMPGQYMLDYSNMSHT